MPTQTERAMGLGIDEDWSGPAVEAAFRGPDPAVAEPSVSCSWDAALPYASFHLAGDLDVEVGKYTYGPGASVVVKIIHGGAFGGKRETLYLPLGKSRARALASAIMGAASEL